MRSLINSGAQQQNNVWNKIKILDPPLRHEKSFCPVMLKVEQCKQGAQTALAASKVSNLVNRLCSFFCTKDFEVTFALVLALETL